jgi:hypothetical protein
LLKFRRYLPALILSAGLLPSAWLLYRFSDTPQLGLAGDDVMYMGAARSLADGQGYREAALPGNPWQTKYPPGYPVMLAAILKANPAARDFWIIAHSWLWLVAASVALAWAMLQAGLSAVQGAVVAALWAANPAACYVGTAALSEALYCALLFLAAGLATRTSNEQSWKAWMTGLLIGTATLIRSSSVIAGGSMVLWFVWRRQFKAAGRLALCIAIPAVIWMAWSRAHLPAGRDPITTFYFDYGGRWLQTIRAAGLGAVVLKNLTYGAVTLGSLLLASKSLLLIRVVRDLVLIALAVAALTEWTGGVFTAIAIATTAFHLVWNWTPDGRFLLVVSPPLLGALVVKLSSKPVVLRVGVLALVAIADIYGTANLAESYSAERGKLAAFAPAAKFIEIRVPGDAVILADERVWLRTGRRVISMPVPMEYYYASQTGSETSEFLLRFKDVAHQFGATYLLIAPWDYDRGSRDERVSAAVRSDPGLEPVFSANDVELFRLR